MKSTYAAENVDKRVVDAFGDEWKRFDQTDLDEATLLKLFEDYFAIFPWPSLPLGSVGFDAGCGSGRWAKFVSQRVGHLSCIDASEAAVEVAKTTLSPQENCTVYLAQIDNIPLPDSSQDFGYCLGVLHHMPDTLSGLKSCVAKLKPGAPFLLYLYYALDGRSALYRFVWRASDMLRRIASRLPRRPKILFAEVFAALVYWPLARVSRTVSKVGLNGASLPLGFYADLPFYVMRNDALDRFGTRIEKRFTRAQVRDLMAAAGLDEISFSERAPYWCAVGYKMHRD